MPIQTADFYYNRIKELYPRFSNDIAPPINLPMHLGRDNRGKLISNPAHHAQRNLYNDISKKLREFKYSGYADQTVNEYYNNIVREFPFIEGVPTPQELLQQTGNILSVFASYAEVYKQAVNMVREINARNAEEIKERENASRIIEQAPIEIIQPSDQPAVIENISPNQEIVLDLDSIAEEKKLTPEEITEMKIAELQAQAERDRNMPVGSVRINFDVEYETRVEVRSTDTGARRGWITVAEYTIPGNGQLITPIQVAEARINSYFYDYLGYYPGWFPIRCQNYTIPRTSDKKYLTTFMPISTAHISVILNQNEYSYFTRLKASGNDDYTAMISLYRNLRPTQEFDVVMSPNPSYPTCYRYIRSSNYMATHSTRTEVDGKVSEDIEEIPLMGVLDKYTLDNILDITKEDIELYKLEGTTYGDKTNQCVPYAINTQWQIREWEAPENKIYNIHWLQSFAEENKLSLIVVDSDNRIITRNVGDHDIMNHRKTLIGVVLENHLSIVTDPELRKSLVERSKSIDQKKYAENRFDPDETEESEKKEDEKKKQDYLAFMLDNYKNKVIVNNAEELKNAMIISGTFTIYYNGEFAEAIATVINNNYDSEGVCIIPSCHGKKKNIKFKAGKISAIRFRDHWIRKYTDEINFAVFDVIVNMINLPMYKNVAPHMELNELISGVKAHYLRNIYSVFNPHSLKFINSKSCVELCRPLIENFNNTILLEQNERHLTEIFSVDISKAFQCSSILTHHGNYARFTGCEIYNDFDQSQNIIKYAFYFVKSDSKHPFYRGDGPFEGNAVIYMLAYGIIQRSDIKKVCVPFDEFDRNEWETFIIYINNTFGPKLAKEIINSVIGCMKPNVDKIYKHHTLTTDINVLHSRIINSERTSIESIQLTENKKLYNISKRGDSIRYKSCHNVRMAIIDRLLCSMIKLYHDTLDARPIFIKTDCIYYTSKPKSDMIEHSLRKYLSSNAEKLPEFCLLKEDSKKIDEIEFNRNVPNFNLECLPSLEKPKTMMAIDSIKWDALVNDDHIKLAEISNLLGAIVEADAGHGKTETLLSLTEFMTGGGLKVLKCAYTNAVKLLTGGETFHSTFRMSSASNKFYKIERILQKRADELDAIMCDECSMITGDVYECLAYMKCYKPSLKIFLFGNWRQCGPVEPNRNIKYKDLALLHWLVDYNNITLIKNHRVGDALQWAEYLKRPTSDFYDSETISYTCKASGEQKEFVRYTPSKELIAQVNTNKISKYPINIAYTNAMCKKINKHRMDAIVLYLSKQNQPILFVDLPKDSNSTYKQPIYLYEGLRLIGRKKVVDYTASEIKKLTKKTNKNIHIENNIDLAELSENLTSLGNNEDLYVNEHYLVEWFETSSQTFAVKTNPEFHNYTKWNTYKISDLHKFFNLGYCFTVHSTQGLTLKVPYAIHEFSKMCYFGEEVLYTALSRANSSKNITLIGNFNTTPTPEEITESCEQEKKVSIDLIHETYDYALLKHIYNNRKKLSHKFNYDNTVWNDIYNYLINSDNINGVGYINVKYQSNSSCARRFAENKLSLQSLPRLIRGSIANQFYYDVDMINTQPTIVYNICQINGVKTPCLERLVKNREEIFNLMGGSRDQIKIAIIAVMNGGKYNDLTYRNQWWQAFINECQYILKCFAQWFSAAIEISATQENAEGKILATVCQKIENNLLSIILEVFSKYGVENNYTLCFDGLLVPKQLKKPINEIIAEAETAFSRIQMTGIKLKCKPMEFVTMEELNAELDAFDWINNFDGRPTEKEIDPEQKLIDDWKEQFDKNPAPLGWLWAPNKEYDYGTRDENFKWAMEESERMAGILDDISIPW